MTISTPRTPEDTTVKPRQSAVLIVDNPLRDIDGIAMLAWQLARRGWKAYIVPMYDQAFAVERLKPDLVVANYVRPNNVELLREYRRRGAAILIVDTEGAAGQTADEFVELVANQDLAAHVDGYCVWGERQLSGFLKAGLLPVDRVKATGCPRYDLAAPQWRAALSQPGLDPGFVLINTNLAGAFPRFSRGTADERATLINVGRAPSHVDRRLRDEVTARDGLIQLVDDLAKTFPDTYFALRPHPFESDIGYRVLDNLPNFGIHQEGTSLEWLNTSALLIHLNCSTAVEAVMLGREALSPQWLDTPALHIEGPAKVSRQMVAPAAFKTAIGSILSGAGLETGADLRRIQADVISDGYFAIDGEASARIADFADQIVQIPRLPAAPGSLRFQGLQAARRLLGPRMWLAIKSLRRRAGVRNYRAKQFDPQKVSSLLQRLSGLAGEASPHVESVSSMTAFGSVLCVSQPEQ